MKTLNRESIIDTVKSIPNGRIARVTYKSELPLKAEFKKQGYHVIKITETTGRFGVNYHHIASVIARKAEQDLENTIRNYTNNYEWIIKNKVKHNNKTGKDYIVLANFNKGDYTKSSYIVFRDNEKCDLSNMMNLKDFMSKYGEMVINSYWNKGSNDGEVKTISFENIIHINNMGEKVNFIV